MAFTLPRIDLMDNYLNYARNAFLPLAITTPVDMKVPLLAICAIVRTSQARQKSSKSLMGNLDSEHLMVMYA